jgi:hypothetical protein
MSTVAMASIDLDAITMDYTKNPNLYVIGSGFDIEGSGDELE